MATPFSSLKELRDLIYSVCVWGREWVCVCVCVHAHLCVCRDREEWYRKVFRKKKCDFFFLSWCLKGKWTLRDRVGAHYNSCLTTECIIPVSVYLMVFACLLLNRGFSGGSDRKESACNAGDPSLIPGWEDPLEKRMTTQYSFLENSMDRGACWAIAHGVTKSQTGLSNFHSCKDCE